MSFAIKNAVTDVAAQQFVTRWIEPNKQVSVDDFLTRYQSFCSEIEPVEAAETRLDHFVAEFCQPINFKNPQSR